MKRKKVMVTIPEEQLRILDGLVIRGAAPTRSALLQQIIASFVSETKTMMRTAAPLTVDGALEGLIAYFLHSLGKAAIDDIFGGESQ